LRRAADLTTKPIVLRPTVFFLRPLFLLLVVIPNLLSIAYYAFIASPVYVSTASLAVSNPSENATSLVSLLAGSSTEGSMEGAYILQDYLTSWEAFQKANKAMDLAQNYQLGDFVSRYGGLATYWHQNDTALWHYYQNHVEVSVDSRSGIARINVYGYHPGFTVTLGRWLLDEATRHMNEMNQRQELDFIANSEQRQKTLETSVKDDEAAIASYRAQIGIYDPQEKSVADLTLANSLTLKLTDLQAQYEAVSKATPDNPIARNLDSEMTVLKAQIADTQAQLPGIARLAARYESLVTTRNDDVTLLQQANLAVQQAQQKAMQNRYYFGGISDPSLPQTPELPHRLLYICGIFLGSFVLWGLLR
jgi:capsular polysaccharide transport system permease protein